MAMRASEHTLRYQTEATCFNEALPLGNGRIGAMVYGGIEEETISLNEDTLWSGYPKELKREAYPEVYQNARELVENGNILKAQEILGTKFGDYLLQMYLPLADIKMRTQHTEAKRYNRTLHLDTAVHTVKYTVDGKLFTRETFVSTPYQVLAVCLHCDDGGNINFEAELVGRLSGCEFAKQPDSLLMYGTAPNSVTEYGKAYDSPESHVYDGRGISYAGALAVKTKGGHITYTGKTIKVEQADEAVIYFGTRTNFKAWNQFPEGNEHIEECLNDVKRAAATDYDILKRASIDSHKKLYQRCEISLSDGSRKYAMKGRIPTNERLARLYHGSDDNALYALLFNFGKYLTITGSREGTQPTNLQGIWNDKIIPTWWSDYTVNVNTEMNYWPTLACGLFECYEPLIRMVEELAVSGKETAEIFYNMEGWVCHHSSDIWRITHPATSRIPNSVHWGFWNMASGWLSVMLWEYYRYTLDQKYLKRIYPVMEGAARFYRGLLTEEDGQLILSPSTSPENKYIENGEIRALDKSTAMTQEIIYDLFTAVSEASDILGAVNEYQELIPRLKRPHIQSNGLLCEWHSDHELWDPHHNHASHLWGLFPSHQFAGDTAIKQAAKKVLESRGDGGTGWSLAWKINWWARLGDGEHALKLLKNQLKLVPSNCMASPHPGGTYPNLLCAHPPFQIDGNFGAANGIIEMLLQCDEAGEPILLPALPKCWRKGCVKNLYLPGNRRISFAWEDGKIVWKKVTENSGRQKV